MGIYLKNINKPTNCFLCHLSYMRNERLFCYLTNEEIIGAKIASECPLIPVPNHGRLIDADALKLKHHWTDDFYETEYVEVDDIDDAPTIIEAEDGET